MIHIHIHHRELPIHVFGVWKCIYTYMIIYVYHRGKYDIHIYASPEFSLNDLFVSPLIDAEVDAICDSNDCSFVTHLFSDLSFVFSFVSHLSSHS